MNRNNAVIFDMDGVLVDNKHIHRQAWVEFCKRLKNPIEPSDFDRVGFGKKNKVYLEAFLKREVSDEEAEKLGEEKESVYRELIEHEIEPVKGLLPLLKRLRSQQVKMAVASSAPRSNIHFVLDRLDINAFFDVLADASMVDQGKPHPDIYQKTARLLNIQPQNCLVFEDSHFGIEAALKAGMHVIALTTSHPYNELKDYACDRIIGDFTELTDDDLA